MRSLLLLFLFPLALQAQKLLKPGAYSNQKFSEPVVLDTGSFVFQGVSFTVPPLGGRGPDMVWLDARKAKSITLVNCQFEGTGKETAIHLGQGKHQFSKVEFRNFYIGIEASKKSDLSLDSCQIINFGLAGIVANQVDLILKNCRFGFEKGYGQNKIIKRKMPKHLKMERKEMPYGIYFTNGGVGSLTLTGANHFFGPFDLYGSRPLTYAKLTGTAIKTHGQKANIEDARFDKWKTALKYADVDPNDNIQKVKASQFNGNARAVEIETPAGTSMNLDFSCNVLSHRVANQHGNILTPALAGVVNPIGIHILPGGELANVGKFDASNLTWGPGANVFPVADGTDRSIAPIGSGGDVEAGSNPWESPTGWTSIFNGGTGATRAFRWRNEFLGSRFPTSGLESPIVTINPDIVVRNSVPAPPGSGLVHVECDQNFDVGLFFPAARVAVINSSEKEMTKPKTYQEQSIPNPSSGAQVLIPYGIEGSYKTAQIEVFELSSGKLLGQYILIEKEGKALVPVQGLAAGMYGYRLVVDGQPLVNRKMVLVK